MHFTKIKPPLALTLCLLLVASGTTLFAKPRGAMPPAPESHLLLLRFDTVDELIATNKAPLDLQGVTSSESWSGYSLHVGGEKSARIAFPEINASGKTNLSFNRGALRFWFKPDWSSESVGGKGPGTDARLFSLTGGETKAGVNERALLFDPTGSALYFSDVNRATLLQTKISWPAGQWHQVVLNYSADGTALYLDGELVAKGEGVSAWPALKEQRAFTIGSDAQGGNLAQGDFEEFTTFAKNLTAEEILWNYRTFAATAALGPITPEEEAAKKQQKAKAKSSGQSGQQMMSLAPPGGGGTTNFGDGSNFTYTNAQTGLRLVNPAWQSNQFTAEIAGGEEGGRYDLFRTTNFSNWNFVMRTTHGQTNVSANLFADPPGFFLLGTMQDSDGDTLTDAYENLVSKTDLAGYTSFASLGGTGPTAAVVFDVPAEVRLRQYYTTNNFMQNTEPCTTQTDAISSQGSWSWILNGIIDYQFNESFTSCVATSLVTCTNLVHQSWSTNGQHIIDINAWSCFPLSVSSFNFSPSPWEKCQITFTNNSAGVANSLVRQVDSQVELATGGKTFSTNKNLYLLTVRATNRVIGDFNLSWGTNIPPSAIQVLGLNLNSNGQCFVALSDNITANVTPVLSTNYSNYVFSVEAVKTKLKILQSGTNITEITKTMWVGQEINLTCALDPAIATITNYQWTVPGERIRDWGTTSSITNIANIAITVPLGQSGLTNANVVFYWMDETNTTLECKVIVKGFEIKSTALFEVRRPQVNLFASVQGTIAFDDHNVLGESLHFGDNTSGSTNPGIMFNVWHTNANMKGYPGPWHQDFRFVQIGSRLEQYNHTNGTCISNFGQGLDNRTNASYPYDRFRPVSTNDPPGQTTTNMFTSDSPGSVTAPFMSQLLRSNNLEMHLVFLPVSTGNAVPVSLWKIPWSWSAKATNPFGIITNLTVYPSNLTAIRTAYSPTWTNNIRSSQFTTNSTPCP